MTNNITFGARVQVKKLEQLNHIIKKSQNQTTQNLQTLAEVNSLSSPISTIISFPASKTAASGATVSGTAFTLNASSVDSFGIVPSVLKEAATIATPATVQSSAQHPLTVGSIFSTIGSWFERIGQIVVNEGERKIPN